MLWRMSIKLTVSKQIPERAEVWGKFFGSPYKWKSLLWASTMFTWRSRLHNDTSLFLCPQQWYEEITVCDTDTFKLSWKLESGEICGVLCQKHQNTADNLLSVHVKNSLQEDARLLKQASSIHSYAFVVNNVQTIWRMC